MAILVGGFSLTCFNAQIEIVNLQEINLLCARLCTSLVKQAK